MAEKGPDLDNRDPNELNSHIQVQFEDVLAEPEGIRSMDCVWTNSYKCFECGKSLCYQILTVLCGICIALEWGCQFAMIAFKHIWCYTPCLRVLAIECGCFQRCVGTCTSCLISPCCEAIGSFFSKINIRKS